VRLEDPCLGDLALALPDKHRRPPRVLLDQPPLGLLLEELLEDVARPQLDVIDDEEAAESQPSCGVEPVDEGHGKAMATVDEDEVQRFAAEVRQHILRTADLEAHVVKTDPPCGAEVADAPHRARIERDAGVMRALESEENGAHALSCLQGAP